MVMGVGSYFGYIPKPDAEWQQIIDRLWKNYGIRSSGSKALDKQILHEHELRDAQKETTPSGKFLTVSRFELEKIIKKKKEKKADSEPKKDSDSTKGAEILGKQIFLAIQMKKEQDSEDNKKKRNNKYQT